MTSLAFARTNTPHPGRNLTRRAWDRFLRWLEERELRAASDPSSPQLFITGLPRSGTTLVSQYAVHRFALAYFTSAAGDHPQAACTVTRWQRALHPRYRSDFVSHVGKSRGRVAPREAGSFWGRHFGFEDYLKAGEVTASACDQVRRTVWRIQNHAGNAPFLNKNVKHMLRFEALLTVFPDAAFIVVERDLGEVALSLLEVRRQLSPDASRWFSVRPPSYPDLVTLPPREQIARQVVDLTSRIERDLARLPASRVARISYRDFCRDPERLSAIILRFHPDVAPANPGCPPFVCHSREASDPEERALVARTRELEASLRHDRTP